MTSLGLLAILALVAWFWLDSLRARELATGICREACTLRGVQFLDQTVALSRISLHWPPDGLRLRRVYRFDFSQEGIGRQSGTITMLGSGLEVIRMDGLPDNRANSG